MTRAGVRSHGGARDDTGRRSKSWRGARCRRAGVRSRSRGCAGPRLPTPSHARRRSCIGGCKDWGLRNAQRGSEDDEARRRSPHAGEARRRPLGPTWASCTTGERKERHGLSGGFVSALNFRDLLTDAQRHTHPRRRSSKLAPSSALYANNASLQASVASLAKKDAALATSNATVANDRKQLNGRHGRRDDGARRRTTASCTTS